MLSNDAEAAPQQSGAVGGGYTLPWPICHTVTSRSGTF
jgi:hypothetical protein